MITDFWTPSRRQEYRMFQSSRKAAYINSVRAFMGQFQLKRKVLNAFLEKFFFLSSCSLFLVKACFAKEAHLLFPATLLISCIATAYMAPIRSSFACSLILYSLFLWLSGRCVNCWVILGATLGAIASCILKLFEDDKLTVPLSKKLGGLLGIAKSVIVESTSSVEEGTFSQIFITDSNRVL